MHLNRIQMILEILLEKHLIMMRMMTGVHLMALMGRNDEELFLILKKGLWQRCL